MLSHFFSRSTAMRRNSFGYRPTRFFATCSSFPCTVCLFPSVSFLGFSPESGRRGSGSSSELPIIGELIDSVNTRRLSRRKRALVQTLEPYVGLAHTNIPCHTSCRERRGCRNA